MYENSRKRITNILNGKLFLIKCREYLITFKLNISFDKILLLLSCVFCVLIIGITLHTLFCFVLFSQLSWITLYYLWKARLNKHMCSDECVQSLEVIIFLFWWYLTTTTTKKKKTEQIFFFSRGESKSATASMWELLGLHYDKVRNKHLLDSWHYWNLETMNSRVVFVTSKSLREAFFKNENTSFFVKKNKKNLSYGSQCYIRLS